MPELGERRPTWPADLDPFVAPDLSRSALVLIDTQVDFTDAGSCPVPGTDAVVPNMARLCAAYRVARRPVVHVVRLYDGADVDLPRRSAVRDGAQIVRPGSSGSQIVPALRADASALLDPEVLIRGGVQELSPHEVVIFKPRWSAFHRTPLDHHLAGLGVDTIVVCGCNYPNCPRASVVDASNHDYRVLLVRDAVSAVAPHHLDELGPIGVVHGDTAAVVAALT